MNTRDFVHLHVHSDFSLLDASAKINDLVNRAKELGMRALALTDHGNMFGILKFEQACRKAGIKPIIGCEFYVAAGSRHEKRTTERGKNLRRAIADKFHFASLDFQSLEGVVKAIGLDPCELCTYCWNGKE